MNWVYYVYVLRLCFISDSSFSLPVPWPLPLLVTKHNVTFQCSLGVRHNVSCICFLKTPCSLCASCRALCFLTVLPLLFLRPCMVCSVASDIMAIHSHRRSWCRTICLHTPWYDIERSIKIPYLSELGISAFWCICITFMIFKLHPPVMMTKDIA